MRWDSDSVVWLGRFCQLGLTPNAAAEAGTAEATADSAASPDAGIAGASAADARAANSGAVPAAV